MNIPITESELKLMQVLWKEAPLNAREITARLADQEGWHRNTVNTFLSRLKQKKAISAESNASGIDFYSPRIAQSDYNSTATRQFVDHLFDGRITPLVASFAAEGQLTAEQIEELQKLLKDLSDDLP